VTLAAFLEGPRRVRLREHLVPAPASDQVRLRVAACGICATDVRAWTRGAPMRQAGVTGHEISGVVSDTGSAVGHLRPGDPVCVEPNLAVCCGDCHHCRAGLTFFCDCKRTLPGWGFAEEVVVPSLAAVKVPELLPTVVAALTEPLACAVNALRRSFTAAERGGRLDDVDVAIVGAGPVGLLALAAARRAGARRVYVVARHEHQQRAVRQLGGEALGESPDQLAGVQPNLVLIAAGGIGQPVAQALNAVARAGEVVVLGLLDEPQQLAARRAVMRGNRVSFSISHSGWGDDSDFAHALAILAGAPGSFEFLLSHRFALKDVARAFDLAANPGEPAFRALIASELRSG
jgi:threonine dehydrogenase-like Zn-dependent dehydrogenase